MSISVRLRFEILKRDGFRCKYCGASSLAAPLEVDHVVPKSDGGPDSADNLVAACWNCNRGKSNVDLEESRLPEPASLEGAREHAKQIRAFLAAQKKVDAARKKVSDYLADQWRDRVGDDPPRVVYNRFLVLVEQYSVQLLTDAMDAVASHGIAGAVNEAKYFHGCLRRMRERGEPGVVNA